MSSALFTRFTLLFDEPSPLLEVLFFEMKGPSLLGLRGAGATAPPSLGTALSSFAAPSSFTSFAAMPSAAGTGSTFSDLGAGFVAVPLVVVCGDFATALLSSDFDGTDAGAAAALLLLLTLPLFRATARLDVMARWEPLRLLLLNERLLPPPCLCALRWTRNPKTRGTYVEFGGSGSGTRLLNVMRNRWGNVVPIAAPSTAPPPPLSEWPLRVLKGGGW